MHSKSRAPNVNRDTAGRKPRQLSFAPVVPATSRSPSFLRQLVARQNAGHGVGAGDVRHDVGSARGLGHGLVDAHLASARPNPALFGCHGPRAILGPDRGTEVDARATRCENLIRRDSTRCSRPPALLQEPTLSIRCVLLVTVGDYDHHSANTLRSRRP